MSSFARVAAAATFVLALASVASAEESSRYSCQPTGSGTGGAPGGGSISATCETVDGKIDGASCSCPAGYVLVDTGAVPAAITVPPAVVTPG
ncbi:MAG: hypothetical protein J0H94_05125 [Rhizobiales bacterium]|nr:hypothetical protein [Hyphomicrobiales bacterium]